MTMIEVLSTYEYTIPTEVGGLNKDTAAFTQEWATRGYHFVDDKVAAKFDPANGPGLCMVDQWYCDLDAVFTWCDQGQEIQGYRMYHELADPEKVCPYSTEEPPLNWHEWGVAGGHEPVQIGTFWYRSSANGNAAGSQIPGSWWYDYTRNPNTNTTGIQRIITEAEYLEIQAANAPPTP